MTIARAIFRLLPLPVMAKEKIKATLRPLLRYPGPNRDATKSVGSAPASFLELLEVAARLQLPDFAVVEFTDTARNTLEFLVSLQRVSRGWDRRKIIAHQLAGLAGAREHLG